MKIPSLDKEFLLQHRDHGIALSIQWFFIESVSSEFWKSVLKTPYLASPTHF